MTESERYKGLFQSVGKIESYVMKPQTQCSSTRCIATSSKLRVVQHEKGFCVELMGMNHR